MQYKVPYSTKTFYCEDCRNEVPLLIWKTISKNIQMGSEYKCERCWDKFDKNFDKFCENKKTNFPKY